MSGPMKIKYQYVKDRENYILSSFFYYLYALLV
jgi:hypothetical protein